MTGNMCVNMNIHLLGQAWNLQHMESVHPVCSSAFHKDETHLYCAPYMALPSVWQCQNTAPWSSSL